jgi:hypothetical protein
MGAAKELFAANSTTIWLAVGEPVVREFESLIAEHRDDEPEFQKFLTAHPQLLDPMAIQIGRNRTCWDLATPILSSAVPTIAIWLSRSSALQSYS